MGRSYYSRRARSTDSAFDAIVTFSALLAFGFWTYPALMTEAAHIFGVVLVIVVTMSAVWVFFNLRKRFRAWRQKHNLSMGLIDAMDGLEFENYVARILKTQGYRRVRLTEKYDLGVDITARKNGISWAIQVKRRTGVVKANAVRQVVTALRLYNCGRAMVISNSSYSHIARQLAESNDCVLIDRTKLLSWIENQ